MGGDTVSGEVRWALRVWSFWPGLAELEIRPQDVMPAAEWALQALRLEATGRWTETIGKTLENDKHEICFGVKVTDVKDIRLTQFGHFPILQSILQQSAAFSENFCPNQLQLIHHSGTSHPTILAASGPQGPRLDVNWLSWHCDCFCCVAWDPMKGNEPSRTTAG